MPATLVAHFEKLIITGDLAPGARLPAERELAAQLAVSRSTLREALHELESKHLIERRPGRGTIVMAKSQAVDELLSMSAGANEEDYAAELRAVIEPTIAALAAQRATDANLLQLRNALNGAHEDLPAAESLRLDVEFHLLLAHAAQNPLLAAIHTMVGQWTGELRAHSHRTRKGRRVSVTGHREIVDALERHDADGARKAMERHLLEVRSLIAHAAAES